jgi:16S rRNA (cytosine1402-N4)-methyltransferase
MPETKHSPVLLEEVLKLLDPAKGEIFVDCTLGGGGHAKEILKRVGSEGMVAGIDFDQENAGQRLVVGKNFKVVLGNFKNIKKIIQKLKIESVSMILADLGFSSDQLERTPGLSFQKDEKLDLRLDSSIEKTAAEILNEEKENELVRIFREYGEEREAEPIAKLIVERRKRKLWEKSQELKELIEKHYKGKSRNFKINPATKIFMALRIAVNKELSNLEEFLPEAVGCLKKGGRLGIISFHSLEDRLVKNFFRKESQGCICEEDAWQCTCGHRPVLKRLNKKPITPSEEERKENPRSRSAKLRVVEKI